MRQGARVQSSEYQVSRRKLLKRGVSPIEFHVLRNVVGVAGENGLVDNADPSLREWREGLHSLVRRGLVTAYKPTALGILLNERMRAGKTPVYENTPLCAAAPVPVYSPPNKPHVDVASVSGVVTQRLFVPLGNGTTLGILISGGRIEFTLSEGALQYTVKFGASGLESEVPSNERGT